MTLTPEQLAERVRLHGMWVRREPGGKRADLNCAVLGGAYLFSANLSGAVLDGAYMRGANLYHANLTSAGLTGANLSDANLRNADLSGADLRYAELTGADLKGARLAGCVGDGVYIRSAHLRPLAATWTADVLQIGSWQHPISAWWSFSDDEIAAMDEEALDFWRLWKEPLRAMIEAEPCKPTRTTDQEGDE